MINLLRKLPCDKRIHFIVGSFIFAFSLLFFSLYSSLLILAIISIGFEFYQKLSNSGYYDLWDAVATFCGSIPILVALLFKG